MTAIFADTFCYIAMLDVADAHHKRVSSFLAQHKGFTITTRWILAETADALCITKTRQMAASFLLDMESDPDTIIVKQSEELYHQGLQLYAERPDKEWSLTDCISFVVMEQHAISEALTGDRHFEQAGFKAIFAT
jgi:uncharacterized protein